MFGKSSAQKAVELQAKADKALGKGHVVKFAELSMRADKQEAKAERKTRR